MKLTNQQIDAIVNEAIGANSVAINEEKDKIRNDKKVISEAEKYMTILEKIPNDIRNIVYNLRSITKDTFIQAITSKIERKVTVLNSNKLRNKIIIASIDSKDIEELKSKLKIEI